MGNFFYVCDIGVNSKHTSTHAIYEKIRTSYKQYTLFNSLCF